MGPSDKMTIFFKEKVNYISYQRQEQEFQQKQFRQNQEQQIIRKPKFTNTKINITKRKNITLNNNNYNNMFFLGEMNQNMENKLTKFNKTTSKSDKNYQFLQNSLLIIDKFIEPILKPDRLLRGKWVPSILNITPNELIFKKRQLNNFRFDTQIGSLNLNIQIQLPDKDKELLLVQNMDHNCKQKIVSQNKTSRFNSSKFNLKNQDFIEDSSKYFYKAKSIDFLNVRPQTARNLALQSKSNVKNTKLKEFRVSYNKLITKAPLSPGQKKQKNRMKKYNLNRKNTLFGHQQSIIQLDGNESIDSLMFVFDNYEKINKDNQIIKLKRAHDLIKRRLFKKLKEVRERIRYRKGIQYLQGFVKNVVSKYEKLDRSLVDSQGYYNQVTKLKKYPNEYNQKQKFFLNEAEYFKEFQFFDVDMYIKILKNHCKFRIHNFQALQRSFQNFRISFIITIPQQQSVQFKYDYFDEISYDALNTLNGVFELSLANYLLDKFLEKEYQIKEDDLDDLFKRNQTYIKKQQQLIDQNEYKHMHFYTLIRNQTLGLLDNYEINDHKNLETLLYKLELIISEFITLKNNNIQLVYKSPYVQFISEFHQQTQQDQNVSVKSAMKESQKQFDEYIKNTSQDSRPTQDNTIVKNQKIYQDIDTTFDSPATIKIKYEIKKRKIYAQAIENQKDFNKRKNSELENHQENQTFNKKIQIYQNIKEQKINHFSDNMNLELIVYSQIEKRYIIVKIQFGQKGFNYYDSKNKPIQLNNDQNLALENKLAKNKNLSKAYIIMYLQLLVENIKPAKKISQIDLNFKFIIFSSPIKIEIFIRKNIYMLKKLQIKYLQNHIRIKEISIFYDQSKKLIVQYDSSSKTVQQFPYKKKKPWTFNILNSKQIFMFLIQDKKKQNNYELFDYIDGQEESKNYNMFNSLNVLFREDSIVKNYFKIVKAKILTKFPKLGIFNVDIDFYYSLLSDFNKNQNPMIKLTFSQSRKRSQIYKIAFHYKDLQILGINEVLPKTINSVIELLSKKVISQIQFISTNLYSEIIFKNQQDDKKFHIIQQTRIKHEYLEKQLVYNTILHKSLIRMKKDFYIVRLSFHKYLDNYIITLYCLKSQRQFQIYLNQLEYQYIMQNSTTKDHDFLIKNIQIIKEPECYKIQIDRFQKIIHDLIYDQIRLENGHYYQIQVQLQQLKKHQNQQDPIVSLNYITGTNFMLLFKIVCLDNNEQLNFKQNLRQLIVLYFMNKEGPNLDIYNQSIDYSDINKLSMLYIERLFQNKFNNDFIENYQIYTEYQNLKVNQPIAKNLQSQMNSNLELVHHMTKIQSSQRQKPNNCQILYKKLRQKDNISVLFYDQINKIIYICIDNIKTNQRSIKNLGIEQILVILPCFEQMLKNQMFKQIGQLIFRYVQSQIDNTIEKNSD